MDEATSSNVDPMTDSIGGMVLAGGLFLIVVVLGAWMWLQHDQPAPIDYTGSLPPMDLSATGTSNRNGSRSSVDLGRGDSSDVGEILRRASEALNARRYLAANGAGALDLYLEVLKKDPYSKEGLDGLDLVLDNMAKKADAGLAAYDMGEAERYIAAISVARPDYGVLVGLHDRLELVKTVQILVEKASRQLSSRKLAAPPGDNAAETYRTILTYEPGHRAAKQGMHKIALGLWGSAEKAMANKDSEQAEELLLQISAVEPGFSKLGLLAKAIAQMSRGTTLEARLASASEAYARGRLAPPDANNAYDLYRRILRDHPKNRDARRGVMRVRDRLLTGTRRALDDRDIAEATAWLERALAAGADANEVEELSRDLAHARRLHRARQGIFEKVLALSDLKPVRRVNPKYPRTGEAEGWVDVEFTVNERGRVKDAVVTDQSVEGVFGRSALAALRRWKFEPVRENGRPIPVRVGFRFTFRAEG